jgi:hypothetical protein
MYGHIILQMPRPCQAHLAVLAMSSGDFQKEFVTVLGSLGTEEREWAQPGKEGEGGYPEGELPDGFMFQGQVGDLDLQSPMITGLPAKKPEVEAIRNFEYSDEKVMNSLAQELIGVLKVRAKNSSAKRGELVILEDEPKIRAAVWAYVDARDLGKEGLAKKLAGAFKNITIQVVVLKKDKEVFYKSVNEGELS